MTGATASATSRTVVEAFAPIAMLDIRMAATAALQLPMAHHDLTIAFTMTSSLFDLFCAGVATSARNW